MPEIICQQRRCGEMPYVIARDPTKAEGPYVVVQHGYTGSLETEVPYGWRFAEAGYTAIVTEADLHGLRKSPEGTRRFESDFVGTIGQVVERTIREIRTLLDHLGAEHVGYFGISMGGFIGFRLASEDPRIEVLCSQISGPVSFWADRTKDAERIRSLDPSLHPERLRRCALLMQCGAADEHVPPAGARQLYQALQSYVPADRLKMIEYEGVGHEVPEAMVAEALAWMRKHLPVRVGTPETDIR